MDESLKVAYRALRALRSQMGDEECDPDALSPESLKSSRAMRDNVLLMLAEDGYVRGVSAVSYDAQREIALSNPRITMRGLEFLESNSTMRRAADAARGIREMLP